MKRVVIALDGLAGTGKTSLAKALAGKLGYVHMNTGLVYRGVGLVAINNGIDAGNEEALAEALDKTTIELASNDAQESSLSIDGIDVTQSLFTREVSQAASKVAELPKVREYLQPVQRNAYPSAKGIVADGRDVGTVLFPDADHKFFIEVDPEIRAERRVAQLYPDLKDAKELERLRKELVVENKERDLRDSQRGAAPCVPADNAKIIDNTGATLTQTLEIIYDSVAAEPS